MILTGQMLFESGSVFKLLRSANDFNDQYPSGRVFQPRGRNAPDVEVKRGVRGAQTELFRTFQRPKRTLVIILFG